MATVGSITCAGLNKEEALSLFLSMLNAARFEAVATGIEDGEAALVELATHRDGEAFARLYDKHVDKVYRRVFYKVFNQTDAEDITQETFVKAWKAIDRYKWTGASFASWLIAIAHNLVVDHYKRKKDTVSLDDAFAVESGEATPEKATETNMECERIRSAIMKLKGDKQKVVLMRFIDGFSYEEIAQAMNKSEGAVRVIQFRALGDLKKVLTAS